MKKLPPLFCLKNPSKLDNLDMSALSSIPVKLESSESDVGLNKNDIPGEFSRLERLARLDIVSPDGTPLLPLPPYAFDSHSAISLA